MDNAQKRLDDKLDAIRHPGPVEWSESGGAAEHAPMTTDEAREYLVKFMEQHFTDKTFHRYIRGQIGGSGPLAGDFAWQMARALRMLGAPASADNPSTADTELEALRQENDKLREALGDSALAATMLHKLSVENGGINAVYSGGAAQILAEALGQQFIESGAENYLEVGFNTNTGMRLLVTLQRCDGKTPANFRAEAEEKLAAAMANLEESRSRVKQLEEMLENRVERKPDSTQEWAKVDGAIAFHLIERHADNWHDAGNMMESWRAANTIAAPVAQSTAGTAKGGITDEESFGYLNIEDGGNSLTTVSAERFWSSDCKIPDGTYKIVPAEKSIAAPAAQAPAGLDLAKLRALVDAARVCTSVTSMREIVECIGALGEKGSEDA